MQTSKTFLQAANAIVPRIDGPEAVTRFENDGAVFVDVRDSAAIAKTGTINGAHRIPRGMLEFIADSNTSIHNPALKQDAEIYLICGAGAQAALAGKTLIEMGFTNVTNIGGIADWIKEGGPIEEG